MSSKTSHKDRTKIQDILSLESPQQELLIRGGHVIDPATKLDQTSDVYIEKGKISRIGTHLSVSHHCPVISAENLVVSPGLIDVHVHLREPGREDKETIATGTRAAAMGGITSVVCMANTQPPMDDVSEIRFILDRAERTGVVHVYPVGAMTKGLAGQQLAEMGAMSEAGAVGFSDDGFPVMNSKLFMRALEYARDLKRPIIEHCEDKDLAAGGAMNSGLTATVLGLPGIPAESEYTMVYRASALAQLTGGHVHIAHISTRQSVDIIRQAKKKGAPISAETCPHYFTLTEEAVKTYNTRAKMNPPLRTEEDRLAIQEGLRDNTIDVISTDHAPHTDAEKEQEFELAPFGIIGLETMISLTITELVNTNVLTIAQAISKFTNRSAEIFRLPAGRLEPGFPADIVIFDPIKKWTVRSFVSKSSNSPFLGRELTGKVIHTIVNGKLIVHHEALLNV